MIPISIRTIALVFVIAFLAPALSLVEQSVLAQSSSEITISAAISMKDSLEEIAELYRAEKPEVTLHFNFGASGTLQQQIEQGAPVDVFISASPSQMNALESKGLIQPGTRRDLVKNHVVLVVPKGKTRVSGFQDLTHPEIKVIAIGEPRAVPAGQYAQEVLTHLGIYDQLKPKFVLGKDVRQVLTYVATGNADAGIVYATDALTSKEVKVVATAPEDSHSPVIYPVATIKTSRNAPAAKAFIDFLLGAKAQEIFKKYGFVSSTN